MPFSFQSRRVGDISVVTCSGRIMESAASEALRQHLSDVLPHGPYIVLDLGDVDFIDSSGIGLLIRCLTQTQAARGTLKLCAVRPEIGEVLRVTRLGTIFESHSTEADAISAFYQGMTSAGAVSRVHADILCVEPSANVLAYVRELLRQAGYGVMGTDNAYDGLILMKAARPKVVVVGAALRSGRLTQTAEALRELADARSVIELPANFSSDDAGEAGRRLLEQVRAVIGAGAAPS